MALITSEEFDIEITNRIKTDARLSSFVGAAFEDNMTVSGVPNYVSLDRVDLKGKLSLLNATKVLDSMKNSTIIFYNEGGVLVVRNPRSISLAGIEATVTDGDLYLRIDAPIVRVGPQQSLSGPLTNSLSAATRVFTGNFVQIGMWIRSNPVTISNVPRSITGWGIIGSELRAQAATASPILKESSSSGEDESSSSQS